MHALVVGSFGRSDGGKGVKHGGANPGGCLLQRDEAIARGGELGGDCGPAGAFVRGQLMVARGEMPTFPGRSRGLVERRCQGALQRVTWSNDGETIKVLDSQGHVLLS